MKSQDIEFMRLALQEATKASSKGEVPVGAIIVMDKKIIGSGHNMCEQQKDATSHAEVIAIREASRRIGDWRLNTSTIYVTLEPCTMCMGAIMQSRISRVVYGAEDPKAGACGSLYNLAAPNLVENELEVVGGVLKEECLEIIQKFFKNIRGAA